MRGFPIPIPACCRDRREAEVGMVLRLAGGEEVAGRSLADAALGGESCEGLTGVLVSDAAGAAECSERERRGRFGQHLLDLLDRR